MSNERFGLYRYWLSKNREQKHYYDAEQIRSTIENELSNSAALQQDAQRNGVDQPLVVYRTSTNTCKVTVLPYDELFIGDVVSVFGEDWICMEVRTDEYGVTYAEIWMCNHTFVYQDFAGNIIKKRAIIDDGSYSKVSDKPIPVTDGTYRCYVPLDEESKVLFVDKRLAIGTALDKNGSTILIVGKIKWLDTKSRNYGNGSHLLTFSMADDVFNKEADNIELMICNYYNTEHNAQVQDIVAEEHQKETQEESENNNTEDVTAGYFVIEGKDSIRIGTSRTFKVTAHGADGSQQRLPQEVEFSIESDSKILMTQNGGECRITVPLLDSLIGGSVFISCQDRSGVYKSGNKTVAVISIG